MVRSLTKALNAVTGFAITRSGIDEALSELESNETQPNNAIDEEVSAITAPQLITIGTEITNLIRAVRAFPSPRDSHSAVIAARLERNGYNTIRSMQEKSPSFTIEELCEHYGMTEVIARRITMITNGCPYLWSPYDGPTDFETLCVKTRLIFQAYDLAQAYEQEHFEQYDGQGMVVHLAPTVSLPPGINEANDGLAEYELEVEGILDEFDQAQADEDYEAFLNQEPSFDFGDILAYQDQLAHQESIHEPSAELDMDLSDINDYEGLMPITNDHGKMPWDECALEDALVPARPPCTLASNSGCVPALSDNGASFTTSCAKTLDGAILESYNASDAGDLNVGDEGASLESKGSYLYVYERFGRDGSGEVIVRRMKHTPRLHQQIVFSEATEVYKHGYSYTFDGKGRTMKTANGQLIPLHMSNQKLGWLKTKPITDKDKMLKVVKILAKG